MTRVKSKVISDKGVLITWIKNHFPSFKIMGQIIKKGFAITFVSDRVVQRGSTFTCTLELFRLDLIPDPTDPSDRR